MIKLSLDRPTFAIIRSNGEPGNKTEYIHAQDCRLKIAYAGKHSSRQEASKQGNSRRELLEDSKTVICLLHSQFDIDYLQSAGIPVPEADARTQPEWSEVFVFSTRFPVRDKPVSTLAASRTVALMSRGLTVRVSMRLSDRISFVLTIAKQHF